MTAIHAREGRPSRPATYWSKWPRPISAQTSVPDFRLPALLDQRARLHADARSSRVRAAGRVHDPVGRRPRASRPGDAASDCPAYRRGSGLCRRKIPCSASALINRRGADRLARQRASFREQGRILQEEIDGMRELQKKGFASANRAGLLSAPRPSSGNEASMAAQMARLARAWARRACSRIDPPGIARAGRPMSFATPRPGCPRCFPKLVAGARATAAQPVRAPASGQVVGLTVFTVGGRRSRPDPDGNRSERPPAHYPALLQPADADDVYPGQTPMSASWACTIALCLLLDCPCADGVG